MFKDSFTTEDWRTLQFAPFWVLSTVGGVDGKVDEKEIAALSKEVSEAVLYKDSLVKEVLQSVGGELTTVMPAYGADSRDVLQGLRDVATVLDSADAEHAAAFKRALVGIGTQVAEASGGHFGKGKTSDEERAAIVAIATALRLL